MSSLEQKHRDRYIERAAERAREHRERAAKLESMGLPASGKVQRRLADAQESIVRNLTALQIEEVPLQNTACQVS